MEGGGGWGGRDIRDGAVLEDIVHVGVLTCTPCAVHFNCYEIVPQLGKSTFMCEQDTCTCSKVYYYYVLIRYYKG